MLSVVLSWFIYLSFGGSGFHSGRSFLYFFILYYWKDCGPGRGPAGQEGPPINIIIYFNIIVNNVKFFTNARLGPGEYAKNGYIYNIYPILL